MLRAMITAGQIRAARALIGWTQTDLAKASGVSEISIKNIERGATDPRSSTLGALQQAFDKAGVMFLEVGDIRDGGAGVRLKKVRRGERRAAANPGSRSY
jgi:predicted transcriptional regulator